MFTLTASSLRRRRHRRQPSPPPTVCLLVTSRPHGRRRPARPRHRPPHRNGSCHLVRAQALASDDRTVAGPLEERERSQPSPRWRATAAALRQNFCAATGQARYLSLAAAVRGFDAVVHTAGVVLRVQRRWCSRRPSPLQVPALRRPERPGGVIDQALAMGPSCTETVALTAAGAFPGLSNILAMECASRLPAGARVDDLEFQYFTAGLGGSGEVNLLITNEGRRGRCLVYQNGRYAPQMNARRRRADRRGLPRPTAARPTACGRAAAWACALPGGAHRCAAARHCGRLLGRHGARRLRYGATGWGYSSKFPAARVVALAGVLEWLFALHAPARRGDRSLRRRDARDARRRDVDRRRWKGVGIRAGARVVPTRRRRRVLSASRWRAWTARRGSGRVHARGALLRRRPGREAAPRRRSLALEGTAGRGGFGGP